MITLICGVGCAGKTTLSKRFENVIHLDDIGLPWERYAKVNTMVAQIFDDVVVEGIYDNADLRSELVKAYRGDSARCIWLNPSRHIVEKQGEKRRVPITKMHMNFEPPTYDEGWDEIIIIEDNNDESINNTR